MSEKYYIVYYDSISQYQITNYGYYVGYKNKISDTFSQSYILAKRYKTLGPVLSRLHMPYKDYGAYTFLRNIKTELEKSLIVKRRRKLSKLSDNNSYSNTIKKNFTKDINSIHILPHGTRIDILEINGNDITYLGPIPNIEIYNFIEKHARYPKREKGYKNIEIRKDATEEDIEDFLK